ncbi:hypothetical protein EMPS_02536 [Entomortierella parvispora]|uniref:MD-2-related lipid-recognition domain-containing protein n=1 Tax=Entomortierella parvispora TaxID=205924 RepID=A0A9P3H5M3_9FUNG|nr:hypothetical protein EMPS_02536 [Entomortierella parvispora]
MEIRAKVFPPRRTLNAAIFLLFDIHLSTSTALSFFFFGFNFPNSKYRTHRKFKTMKTTSLLVGIVATALALLVSVEAAPGKQHKDHHHHKYDYNKDPLLRMTFSKSHRREGQARNNPHALSAEEERFKSCGGSKDLFHIQSITSNRHLCSGCKACINIEGMLQGPVDEGSKVRLTVSKYIFTVFDQTYDLCAMLARIENGPRCPLAPNSDGLRACLPLDKSLTTGISAGIRVAAVDSKQNPLFCIEGSAMVEKDCPRDVGPGSYACEH